MNMYHALVLSLQLEKYRVEQLGKYYPNLISTQTLGHVSGILLIQLFLLIFDAFFVCLDSVYLSQQSDKWIYL